MRKKQPKYASIIMFLAIIFIFCVTLFALTTPKIIQNDKRQVDTVEPKISEEMKQSFFAKIRPIAKKNQQIYQVLSSITLAQAALESEFGTSQLATQYYNLFGVKGNSYNGVFLPTMEFVNNEWVSINDYFKIYDNWEESIEEHGQLLAGGTTWNPNQYEAVLTAKTYQEAANGLVSGGYATDPNYANKIISMIEQYKLYQYDK